MDIVATLKPNQPVSVARYEGDQKVGERNIYMADFIGSLIQEYPLSGLIAEIRTRTGEIPDYFKELEKMGDFNSLMSQFLLNAHASWVNDIDVLPMFVADVFSRLNEMSEINPHISEFILRMVKALPSIELNSHYEELAVVLIEKMLRNDDLTKLSLRYSKSINQLLKKSDADDLKKVISNILPAFDSAWLNEQLQKTLSNQNNPIVYGISEIPQDCKLMAMGTMYNSYVFEVPKSRIRVKYADVSFDNVGHPRIICVVKVKDQKVDDMLLFSAKDGEQISKEMDLYRYPFSHVYRAGSVCWSGAKEFNFDQIHMLPQMFLQTSNLGHLAADVLKKFKELSNNDFNEESLTPLNIQLKEVL